MLEVFSRDRGTDFEFFVFGKDSIKYRVRDYHNLNADMKQFYKSLENGTLLINNNPLSIENVTEEQIEYIKNIMMLFQDKVDEYRKSYKPVFLNHTYGNSLFDIIGNKNRVEVPDPKKMKEWTHIKGFEYLESFISNYEKSNQNNRHR
ncbi:MAG: hypothetical protein IKE63_05800 [Bacilli bacterium]|nr:hypothetical protein [Bacilli bacterium]